MLLYIIYFADTDTAKWFKALNEVEADIANIYAW